VACPGYHRLSRFGRLGADFGKMIPLLDPDDEEYEPNERPDEHDKYVSQTKGNDSNTNGQEGEEETMTNNEDTETETAQISELVLVMNSPR
jgi:hypothetical protein